MLNQFVHGLLTFSLFAIPQPQAQSTQSTSELAQVVEAPMRRIDPPPRSASVEVLEAQGDSLRGQKDFLDAVDYYRAALAKAPKEGPLWNKMGITELLSQRYAEAKRDFERSIHLDRQSSDAYNNLGVIFYLQKKYKNAIREYDLAIQIQPESASYYSNLGAAYFSKKEFEEATHAYSHAVQLDPTVFERTSHTGIAAQMSSPEDRAHFEYVLAKLFAKEGDSDRSLEYLKKALEEGYKEINDVYKDPEFQTLRSDARFTQLMAARPPAIPE
jgi:tetratricopeptide (TPR) repeat protein